MNLVVWKNYLEGQILYKSLVPPIKTASKGKGKGKVPYDFTDRTLQVCPDSAQNGVERGLNDLRTVLILTRLENS